MFSCWALFGFHVKRRAGYIVLYPSNYSVANSDCLERVEDGVMGNIVKGTRYVEKDRNCYSLVTFLVLNKCCGINTTVDRGTAPTKACHKVRLGIVSFEVPFQLFENHDFPHFSEKACPSKRAICPKVQRIFTRKSSWEHAPSTNIYTCRRIGEFSSPFPKTVD